MNKKILIIIFVTFLALIAIYFGVVFFFGGSSSQETATGPEQPFGEENEDIERGGELDESGEPVESGGSGGEPNEVGIIPMGKIFVSPYTTPEGGQKNGSEVFRYVEKETGHVFEQKGEYGDPARISSTTIPGISDVWWLSENMYVMKISNRDTPTHYLVEITQVENGEDGGVGTGGGIIAQQRLIPEPSHISYSGVVGELILTQDLGSRTEIGTLDEGGQYTTIYQSPFPEWVVQHTSSGSWYLFPKASNGISGNVWQLASGTLSKIFGPAPGLVAQISPDESWMLINTSEGTSLSTQLIDISTGNTAQLPFDTLIQKCVWLSEKSFVCARTNFAGGYILPDSWYKGGAPGIDELTIFSLETGQTDYTIDLSFYIEGGIDVSEIYTVGNSHIAIRDRSTQEVYLVRI